MPRSIRNSKVEDFEPKRKNPIGLLDDSNLDSHLKSLKIGDKNSPLQISESQVRIDGDFQLDGELTAHKLSTTSLVGTFTIDKNTIATTTSTIKGAVIDYDHTGISASGQTVTGIGLDIDMNCETVTHVGNVFNTGIDINMVAADDGFPVNFQSNVGIAITTDGGNGNIGMFIVGDFSTYDHHIKLAASADTNDYASFVVKNSGDLKIETVGSGTTDSDIILEADGDIELDAATGITRFYLAGDTNDYASLTVAANGVTTLATFDDGGTVGHLTVVPDGDLVLDPVSTKVIINATDGLYLDGGGDTYIAESSADRLDIKVGGDMIFQITESGADGNTIDIDNACIGFTQLEPLYNASTTTIDFRHSNKQFLTFGAGNITNVNIFFPLVSGNFVLLLKQDGTGSRTITNYKVYEFDESSADGSAGVVFAGGSNPTLTTDANHVDILSFYWDADNEIAYGVSTLDFQF